jgi:hypothetical protein
MLSSEITHFLAYCKLSGFSDKSIVYWCIICKSPVSFSDPRPCMILKQKNRSTVHRCMRLKMMGKIRCEKMDL